MAKPKGLSQSAAGVVALTLLTISASYPAVADDYPSKPITLIIPFAPGGGVDTVGRVVAAKLTTALGQQVVVENRPGAGSVIGIRAAAKAVRHPPGVPVPVHPSVYPPWRQRRPCDAHGTK